MESTFLRARYLWRSVAAALIVLGVGTDNAHAFSIIAVETYGDTAKATDILQDPDNYYTYGPGDVTITWKMEDGFLVQFPHPLQHDQVRLSFREWATASTSQARRDAPHYSWHRNNGTRKVTDLRTAMMHEIGHAIGSQHPAASWFNNDFNHNFEADNDGYIAAPPIGGELMNEGWDEDSLPDSKPSPGLAPGDYIRLVSKDELAFLDYVYGGEITFQEVFGNTPADLLVQAFENAHSNGNVGPGGVLQSVFFDEDENKLLGKRITLGFAKVRQTTGSPDSPIPISFESSPASWELTNDTGDGVIALQIRTRGSDNPNPLNHSSSGVNAFGSFATAFPGGTDFEDLNHLWFKPAGGVVPSGSVVDVGLNQDAWDWTVVNAVVQTSAGNVLPACLVRVFEWFKMRAAAPQQSRAAGGEAGLRFGTPGVILAQGFQIVATDARTRVMDVIIADARNVRIAPSDIGSATVRELDAQGLVQRLPLPDLSPIRGQRKIVVVFKRRHTEPPPERRTLIVIDRPEMDAGQWIVGVTTECEDEDNGTIDSFAALNTGPDYPLFKACDADRNGEVEQTDLEIIAADFGQAANGLYDNRDADGDGDGDGDGAIGTGDLEQCFSAAGQ